MARKFKTPFLVQRFKFEMFWISFLKPNLIDYFELKKPKKSKQIWIFGRKLVKIDFFPMFCKFNFGLKSRFLGRKFNFLILGWNIQEYLPILVSVLILKKTNAIRKIKSVEPRENKNSRFKKAPPSPFL